MGLEGFIQSGFANTDLYERMYAQYLEDPSSVDSSWQLVFKDFEKEPTPPALPSPLPIPKGDSEVLVSEEEPPPPLKQIRIFNLIQAYRMHGHLLAKVNPVITHKIPIPLELRPDHLGFSENELTKKFPTCGIAVEEWLPLQDIIKILQEIYCGSIGVEYMDCRNPELERWLQKQVEPSRFKIQLSIDQKQMILQHLNKSSLFEWFLQTKYVGQKRFSLEGGETLIPIMAAILETGSNLGMEEFVIGMAHRGRLNVLCNILDKSYSTIFSEFEDHYVPESFEGSGDVKYHKGFTSEIETASGHQVKLFLSPNPSHLESVNPVVEGISRAKQRTEKDKKREKVVPILVHGDAALSGQGVVYETMQMGRLRGYSTGGTIHVVINNQIGFTTIPEDARSTHYCTDIARAFDAPVFHVNAEDPEACIYATILAIEIRQRFHCDVFIDMYCYRKYGHNESDEPAFTQPLEYQAIRSKQSLREMYRDQLLHEGVLERYLAEQLEEEFKKGLQQALKKVKELTPQPLKQSENIGEKIDFFKPVKTAVSYKKLSSLTESIFHIPDDFVIHRKLKQLVDSRKAMVLEKKPIDWGMAETLAYATLLDEGTHIRISGQDCGRGTFSHRHAVWMDQEKEREYYPLKNLGDFEIYNSHLSEMGVLGFEYGYSVSSNKDLIIWEAQFGDFSNGAQVIMDQYISTGEQKWGQNSNLVLFLPHGYEGQGPEHSSARMERFLTLSGEDNIVVVNPTLPAQMFHVLRRQILSDYKKPLVIFTPKGLLRLPECVSSIDDFSKGSFQEVLKDPDPPPKPTRCAICCGRIYYDLAAERKRRKADDIVLLRIEQLYPLNTDKIRDALSEYSDIKEFIWVQEEPSNMGAWNFIRHQLPRLLPAEAKLSYAGRDRSASPATGSYQRHQQQHMAILDAVFPGPEKIDVDVNLMQRV